MQWVFYDVTTVTPAPLIGQNVNLGNFIVFIILLGTLAYAFAQIRIKGITTGQILLFATGFTMLFVAFVGLFGPASVLFMILGIVSILLGVIEK